MKIYLFSKLGRISNVTQNNFEIDQKCQTRISNTRLNFVSKFKFDRQFCLKFSNLAKFNPDGVQNDIFRPEIKFFDQKMAFNSVVLSSEDP